MKHIYVTMLLIFSFTLLLYPQDVFYDEFEDNSNGWDLVSARDREFKIEDGQLIIDYRVDDQSYALWRQIFTDTEEDFYFEIKIKQLSGNFDYGYGFLFASTGWDNGYLLELSGDQFHHVCYWEDDSPFLDLTEWQEDTDIVNPINEWNVLSIKREDDEIVYSVNGEEIYEMDFEKYYGNNIGFKVGGKMKIAVDYIKIEPAPEQINLVENAIRGFEKENLGPLVNSEFDELGPRITADGKTLYIVRKEHPGNYGADKEDDIWVSELQPDNTWGKAYNIGKPLNNTSNNFVVSVSSDGNQLYIANIYDEYGEPAGQGVSVSTKTRNGWSVPAQIEIEDYYNDNDYVDYFFSVNRKFVIMAIERNDSEGERDLYVSFLDEDGEYSEPQSLGEVVNTPMDEGSPFLAADNKTLFFNSEGFPGYGSADVFVTKRLDDTWENWSEPKNLGPEVNTSDWDGDYTLPASGDFAYMASYEDSYGGADIYRIPLTESAKPDPVVLVYGKVLNKKTNEPIEANIFYNDLRTQENLGLAVSNATDGSYSIVLPYGKTYSFMATDEDFYSVSENLNLTDITEYAEIERNLYLQPIEVGVSIRLNNIFFEFGEATLMEESFAELDRLVKIMEDNSGLIIEIGGHTDNKGTEEFNQKLSQNRAESVVNYLISKGIDKERLSYKGYGETKPVDTNETEEGRAFNRRVEFTIVSN